MSLAALAQIPCLLRLGLLVGVLWSTAALAQEVTGPDFTAWAEQVTEAELLLGNPDTPNESLQTLRQELTSMRTVFQDAESVNRSQIDRINRQIESLGPAPAEGEAEPDGLASRRAELSEELAALQDPSLRATEAYVAADALIATVDKTLRDREAQKVLARSPSPLNPLNWFEAVTELRDLSFGLPKAIIESLRSEEKRLAALASLPVASGSILIGALLLFRAPTWIGWFDAYMASVRSGPMNLTLRGALALLQLGLPTIGLLAMIAGLEITGLFGDAGSAILLSLAAFATTMIFGVWLVRRLFPTGPALETPLLMTKRQLRKGRLPSRALIIVLAIYAALSTFVEQAEVGRLTQGYAIYIVTVLLALLLIRIMRLFVVSTKAIQQDSEAKGFNASVVRVMATIGTALAAAGIVSGLAGYLVLAERIILPSVASFLIFGFLALLQKGFSDFYTAVSHHGRTSEESLIPTLFGTVLIILSLPFLALLWGALPNDLVEFWNQLRNGFVVGGVEISPAVVLQFLVVFTLCYGVTRLVQGALRTAILPKTRIDLGGRNAIVSGVGYVGIMLAGIVAFTSAGINLSSLAIFASALAIGVGFGLQTIVSNFVSGIILLIERPVSEGDWIEVGGQMGYVRRISVRATRIETFDRTDVIIPNADLISGQVTNWTRGNLIGRVIIPVRVAYGVDTRRVERILMEIAEEQPMVVLTPPPAILFMGFGTSALEFEIRAILRDINFMLSVQSDVNHEIVRRFAREKIEIPFPQQDIWLRDASDRRKYVTESLEPAPTGPMPMAPPEPDADR
jgi:small-conductance mechanosensitive channel